MIFEMALGITKVSLLQLYTIFFCLNDHGWRITSIFFFSASKSWIICWIVTYFHENNFLLVDIFIKKIFKVASYLHMFVMRPEAIRSSHKLTLLCKLSIGMISRKALYRSITVMKTFCHMINICPPVYRQYTVWNGQQR